MILKKLIVRVLTLIAVLITIILIAGIIGPFIYWASLKNIPLKVFILDKTVPQMDYREHKGLMWALNHFKVVDNTTGASLKYDKDYFGFFPKDKDNFDIIDLPLIAEQPDLIYLTDTYGVFNDDYLKKNDLGSRSPMMYGGLLDDDIRSVKMQLGKGNTLIGEFNIASSPTLESEKIELAKLFGLSWNGWKGRYFLDLAKGVEVPQWLIEDYEVQYKSKWNYQGAGIVLINDKEEVYVMEEGKHFGGKDLHIIFSQKYENEFSVKEEVPYYYWFEFVEPDKDSEVIANYSFMDLTSEGQKVLTDVGLPNTFPAIVRKKNAEYKSYYFAGDFADLKTVSPLYNYYGYSSIMKNISIDIKGQNTDFYWRCYVPLMKKIIADIEYEKTH